MERRERDRVQVKLECQVERPGLPGQDGGSVTENISRTGMLIRWARKRSAAPAIGDAVVVKLKMPRNPVFGQRWMLFRAQVVRVSHTQDRSLMVAVTGSPVRFSGADEATQHCWVN